jgi:hypothetical protein
VAYIRKAGSKWRVQVERQGVRKSASFDTKSEASQWAAHEESAILSAARGHYPRRTFAEAVDEYLSRVSVRKRSLKWERNAFARLAAHFGDKALIRDIDEAKVAGWRDARLQTVSGSTVQREANLLRNLFTVARDEWKWIGHSPFKGVKLPAENQPRYQVWRWPLVKRVLRAPRTGKTAEMQRAFHIALRTGMRLSEVLQAPGGVRCAAAGRGAGVEQDHRPGGGARGADRRAAVDRSRLHGERERGLGALRQTVSGAADRGSDLPRCAGHGADALVAQGGCPDALEDQPAQGHPRAPRPLLQGHRRRDCQDAVGARMGNRSIINRFTPWPQQCRYCTQFRGMSKEGLLHRLGLREQLGLAA